MLKIQLFLPDFRALVKGTFFISENQGPNHPVFYYETENDIYFYKPVGAFIYCFNSLKERTLDEITVEGLSQEQVNEFKVEFKAIELPQKLCETYIEMNTNGVIR